MAKKNETAKKEKTATFKDKLFDIAGMAIASELTENDVVKVKPIDTPEGVLVDAEGKHYYITITEKKKQIEYEAEDVRRNYTAEVEAAAAENKDGE